MMNNPPIANAPRGYLWRWNTYRIAHLVSIKVRRQALCGKRASGAYLSSHVGGYTARPCVTCLQEVENAGRR